MFKRQILLKKPDIKVDIIKNVPKIANFRPKIGLLLL